MTLPDDISALTPELIEGLAKDQIVDLKKLAMSLHEATGGVLETPMGAKDAEQEQDLREALMLKLSESINFLDSQIADLKAVQKDLRIVKGYQQSDKRRIESYKIGLYIKEKELRC